MKIKGFTLVELLAVLVVLAVIFTITFPIVTDIIDDSKDKAYNQQYENLVDAARNWEIDNHDLLIEIDENNEMKNISCYLTVERLKDEGYLEKNDLIDPTNNSSMEEYVVSVEYDLDQYYYWVYEFEEDAQNVTWIDEFGEKQHLSRCP